MNRAPRPTPVRACATLLGACTMLVSACAPSPSPLTGILDDPVHMSSAVLACHPDRQEYLVLVQRQTTVGLRSQVLAARLITAQPQTFGAMDPELAAAAAHYGALPEPRGLAARLQLQRAFAKSTTGATAAGLGFEMAEVYPGEELVLADGRVHVAGRDVLWQRGDAAMPVGLLPRRLSDPPWWVLCADARWVGLEAAYQGEPSTRFAAIWALEPLPHEPPDHSP